MALQINWETLGGGMGGDVSVVSSASGRLDLFARGTDNTIYHKYFQEKWFPSSTTWESLGGVAGKAASDISAVSWAEGRLDLFVRGADNVIYHKWFQNEWGPSSTTWESLAGATLGVSAVSWAEGRLDVFVIGTDHGIYHKWFDGTWQPSSTGGWEPLGAQVAVDGTIGNVVGNIAAVSWCLGRLDLFILGVERAVDHKSFEGEWLPSTATWETIGWETIVGQIGKIAQLRGLRGGWTYLFAVTTTISITNGLMEHGSRQSLEQLARYHPRHLRG